jgi:hypothetical protein
MMDYQLTPAQRVERDCARLKQCTADRLERERRADAIPWRMLATGFGQLAIAALVLFVLPQVFGAGVVYLIALLAVAYLLFGNRQ